MVTTVVPVRLAAVQDLQHTVDDASLSVDARSLEVRRFCNEYKPSAPIAPATAEGLVRTNVDTDHLLSISSDMALLSSYLVERVVAAS